MKKKYTVDTTIEAGFEKSQHIQIDYIPKIFENSINIIEAGFKELPHIQLTNCIMCHRGFPDTDESSKVKLCSQRCKIKYMLEEHIGFRECIFCHKMFPLRTSNVEDEYCSLGCFGRHDNQIWNNNNMRIYRHTEIGKMVSSASDIKRRESKKNIISTWTKEELKNKRMETKGICCGYKREPHYVGIDKLTLDHMYALMRAYRDYLRTGIKRIYTIDDVQFLCRSCNSRKHSKLIIENDKYE